MSAGRALPSARPASVGTGDFDPGPNCESYRGRRAVCDYPRRVNFRDAGNNSARACRVPRAPVSLPTPARVANHIDPGASPGDCYPDRSETDEEEA
jgi:hypothetical protein